jgi:outer membrane protein assembly factor BamB
MPEGPILAQLHTIVKNNIFVEKNAEVSIISSRGSEQGWLFDFRSKLLDADFLNLVADFFWQTYHAKYPFQVGGLETASLPLITTIVLKGKERGTPVNGFYVRKSRKPEGLQKIVEGELTNTPIILVDDLINSGGTFIKQLAVLENEGKNVTDIFTLVRFRDLSAYQFAHDKHITITAPFTLADLGLSLESSYTSPNYSAFEVLWAKQYGKPNYYHRVPKSAPAIDERYVYFGSDDGVMRALNQTDGSLAWEYKMLGFGTKGKTIFSSPALCGGVLYFGAYDGNFYALDAATGKKKWIYMDADWIGSSPCVAKDVGLVFIGLEYGLWKKRGGIVALDAKTGERKWEYISMPEYTHGSPVYSKKFNVVAIGSNDGYLYLFRATDGKLLWKLNAGGEIKAAPTFDEQRGYVVFGSFDGNIYVVRVSDGVIAYTHKTGAGLYSTPLVSGNYLYASSLDKRVYCLNLDTLTERWVFKTAGRIFASPAIYNNHIYIGSNDGRLYELDAETGKNTSCFQTTERITNKIAYNKDTKHFFVLTYANELYCLKKNNESL